MNSLSFCLFGSLYCSFCSKGWLHQVYNSWSTVFIFQYVDYWKIVYILGFPGSSCGKESACNVGDLGSIPGLGRSPGEGNGYLLQCSGLENSMHCIVHGVAKSWTWLSNFHFHFRVDCVIPFSPGLKSSCWEHGWLSYRDSLVCNSFLFSCFSLSFDNLIILCLCEALCWFNLFEVFWTFWIWTSISVLELLSCHCFS